VIALLKLIGLVSKDLARVMQLVRRNCLDDFAERIKWDENKGVLREVLEKSVE